MCVCVCVIIFKLQKKYLLLLEKNDKTQLIKKEKNNNSMQSYSPAIPTGVSNCTEPSRHSSKQLHSNISCLGNFIF